MSKKEISILYPDFTMGGGDAVTIWMVEALKEAYNVTLFTWSNIKIETLNNLYGTRLLVGDIKILRPQLSFIFSRIPGLGLLKYHFLIRYLKKVNFSSTAVIGTYKEADFGKKGIQYIHFPQIDYKDLDLDFFSKQYYRNGFLRKLYKKICYTVSGFKWSNAKENITLTNSNWTKMQIKKIMGIESNVVYPPVLNDFLNTPWEERENGFICIGRISPEKRIELVIEIVDQIRKAGFNTHLHIVGPVGDRSYYKETIKLQEKNPWVFIEGLVNRKKLASLVSMHKYGLHGRKDEHFGISIAEKVKAGCIVFVPDDGGQVEIVGSPELTYSDKEDAVYKIKKVLDSRAKQDELRNFLFSQGKIFSTENFQYSVKKIVEDFLARQNNNG